MKRNSISNWLKKAKFHFSYYGGATLTVKTIRNEDITFHSISDVYILEFEKEESCKAVLINTNDEVDYFGSIFYLH